MIVVENKKDIEKAITSLKQKDAIMFINCHHCIFTISNKVNKIIIYNCENCTFNLYTAISSLELCKCLKLKVQLYGEQQTTQLDLVHESEIHYMQEKGFVVSCGTDDVIISTPNRKIILPYHVFMQQYVTNLETWITKRESSL